MKVGDRVRHRKYGLGIVKACGTGAYLKYQSARVLYDSGHETVNALVRLTPVAEPGPSVNPDKMPVLETQTPVKRRGGAGANVDYDLIDRAKEYSRERHPEAVQIVGRWYGGRAYTEVWGASSSALIEFYPGD